MTTFDDSWNDKIAIAKATFTADLDGIAKVGGPGVLESVQRMRAIDERYATAGDEVLSLYQAGEFERALDLHLSAEHEISHEIEDELNLLITDIEQRVHASAASLASLHRFLLFAVAIFSGASLLIALGLGRHCPGRSSGPFARSTLRSRGSPGATSASMSKSPTATSSAGSPST